MNANEIINILRKDEQGDVSPNSLVIDFNVDPKRKHRIYAKVTKKLISLKLKNKVEIQFHKTSKSLSFKFDQRRSLLLTT